MSSGLLTHCAVCICQHDGSCEKKTINSRIEGHTRDLAHLCTRRAPWVVAGSCGTVSENTWRQNHPTRRSPFRTLTWVEE